MADFGREVKPEETLEYSLKKRRALWIVAGTLAAIAGVTISGVTVL